MRSEQVLFLLSTAAGCARAADTVPRGVGPEFVSFYKPSSGKFQCISNPSVELPFDSVNNDFCDCPDGSDEPGTAACAHLSSLSPQDPSSKFTSKPALPGFYCENKGHIASYIPFTNVNDGICDYDSCCDGSDEYKTTSKVQCNNKCDEIGKEWRKHDEARQKSYSAAVKKRGELTAEAAKKRQEIEKEIGNLKVQIEAGEVKVKQLEKDKIEIEAKEKNRLVQGGGSGGKLTVLLGLVKPRVDRLQLAIAQLRNQRNSYWYRIKDLEEILETFHKEYNPNFNDEGVKRAVRSYEEYIARADKQDLDFESAEEAEVDSLMSGSEDDIDWDEFDQPEAESDVEALYSLQAYLPLSVRQWISDKASDLRTMLIANGILASPATGAAGESKAVREATQQLKAEQDSVERSRKEKKEHEEDLTKDYGPDDVWRTLKGACVSLDAGEYNYELCWLKDVHQKSKKGGSSQNMGSFGGYDTTVVDDDLPPNGKGLGSGTRLVHKYKNGNHCWNGPNRSTMVVLACAEKEEIWKVTEEEKCVYRMEVGTPAVCDLPGREQGSSVKISGAKPPTSAENEDDDDEEDDVAHDEL